MPRIKELHVNGAKRAIEAEAERSLLGVLRDGPGWTGCHEGCGEARPGACTVLVDGQPIRSGVTKVGSVEGKQVKTIESLAADGRLHPVQEAFLECDALQCGY